MTDLFGAVETPPAFIDIRNTRESVAQEKARLCMELNALLKKSPRASAIATVQTARQFKAAHKAALKALQAKDSSRTQLQAAINSMGFYQ